MQSRKQRLRGNIVPLDWIGLVIVQFFAAVSVSDVSPALIAHGVIDLPQRGNRDMLPVRVRVFEQRLKTDAFESGIHGQATNIDQRRIAAQ